MSLRIRRNGQAYESKGEYYSYYLLGYFVLMLLIISLLVVLALYLIIVWPVVLVSKLINRFLDAADEY